MSFTNPHFHSGFLLLSDAFPDASGNASAEERPLEELPRSLQRIEVNITLAAAIPQRERPCWRLPDYPRMMWGRPVILA